MQCVVVPRETVSSPCNLPLAAWSSGSARQGRVTLVDPQAVEVGRYHRHVRYQPVRTLADAEALAASTEGRSVDFKGTADPEEWWELAKDIAAFANHVGGTILVGASEQADGTANLFGIPPEIAKALGREYENASRDKCKPRPLSTVDPIALANGNVVLAINVEPYPLALVGAMFYALNRNGEPETCDAWRFPVRVGKHNIALQPDQIAMFMEPRTRRVVTLLEGVLEAVREPPQSEIPTRRPAGVYLHYVLPNLGRLPGVQIKLLRVDVMQNAFAFSTERVGDGRGRKEYTYEAPLDDVEAVWQGSDGGWQIRVSGYLDTPPDLDRYVSRSLRSP